VFQAKAARGHFSLFLLSLILKEGFSMLGISVYLQDANQETMNEQLKLASEHGLKSIFTSLHIPEDDSTLHEKKLKQLGELALTYSMELFADISPRSFDSLSVKKENLSDLLKWGITGIRADYGFTNEEMIRLSNEMKIGINASTVSEKELDYLIKSGLNIHNVEAWHNYYPRPETGLSLSFLQKRNRAFHDREIKTMAFVPGDQSLRGPLFAGLPTLEKHRNQSPYHSAAELLFLGETDKVLIGDHSLKETSLHSFNYLSERIITLQVQTTVDVSTTPFFHHVHTNRMDPARDVIRSVESRKDEMTRNEVIERIHPTERLTGSITIDNELYGRYAGELQITKRNLPSDKRVNVVGQIIDEDLPLLDFIGPGVKFQFKVRNK
jgi:hypothetical protein